MKCKKEGIRHREAERQGSPSTQILNESLYYDLIMVGLKSYFHFETSEKYGRSLDQLLKESVTPIYGIPEKILNWEKPDRKIRDGGSFFAWLHSDHPQPYNSWGNGAAMRVSPVGFAFNTEDEVLSEAAKTAGISHNHPEGVKGAQATALSVYLSRMGHGKDELREQISQRFGYDLHRTVNDIRPAYAFDISCQGTVPEAIIAFLDSSSYEDAVRNAISLGGDSDTLACITGGIAEAFYRDVSDGIRAKVREILTPDLLRIADAFCRKYI